MKKYKIILSDPPWTYRNKNTGNSMNSGASAKYPVLTTEELCNLNIGKIADKNSVLFLWATTPLLPEAFEVMKTWHYTYKTSIFWRKIMSMGMGYYFRGQVEMLLVGIKGKVKAFRIQKANFIQTKALKHSQKPEEFRQLIELTGLDPKIELFATKKVQGWDAWGLDIDGIDIRDKLKQYE